MISLKKLLYGDPGTGEPSLRVAQILVQGIGLHAMEGDRDEYRDFRDSMERLSAALETGCSSSELMVQAGAALQALEDYNRRTTRYLRLQSAELQSMVKMLTGTIGEISAAGNENVGRLHEIERQIADADQIDDIRKLKEKLSVCLTEIRQEAERQKAVTLKTVGHLTDGLDRAQIALDQKRADPVTGLPGRPLAADSIAKACEAEEAAFAVVMALDRIQTINTTFGYEVGDQLLRYFAGLIRRNLPQNDQLFRWSGPALVALLSRSNRIETVRDEMTRVMEHKFEHTVRTATRSILLPLSARWAVFPMMASPRLLIQKIDGFATLQPVTE